MIKLISLVKDFFRKPKRKGLIYSDPVYEFFDGAELKSVVKNTNWDTKEKIAFILMYVGGLPIFFLLCGGISFIRISLSEQS